MGELFGTDDLKKCAKSEGTYEPAWDETRRLFNRFADECQGVNGLCTVSLRWMKPMAFLSMTPPVCGYSDDGSPPNNSAECTEAEWYMELYEPLEKITDILRNGEDIDPPFLNLTCKTNPIDRVNCAVFSHEGRHRAKIAHDLGIPFIPVIVVEENPQAQKFYIEKCKRRGK